MRPGNGQVDDQADHDDNWGTESVAESEVPLLHPDQGECDRPIPRVVLGGAGGGGVYWIRHNPSQPPPLRGAWLVSHAVRF